MIGQGLIFYIPDHQPAPPAKTFVLVRSSWQGAFVWQAVKTQLEQHGQKVVVVELPAHRDDTTAPQNVTIDAYRDKVIAAIDATKQKVVLVGHSMGGAVITAIAEKIPAQIEKLVYIGAFVPANGECPPRQVSERYMRFCPSRTQ